MVITGANGHIAINAGGVHPAVTFVDCVRNWTVNYNGELGEMVCSSSRGGRLRIPGNRDWTGSWNGYGSIPSVMPGQTVYFSGVIEHGGAADGDGLEGLIIIDSVEITFDVEAGLPISYVCNFGGIGALEINDNIECPEVPGSPSPESASVCSLVIQDVAGAGDVTIPQVRTMTLTFTCDNQVSHVSGTAPWPSRARGNLDVTLAATVYAEDEAGWKNFPNPHWYDVGQPYATGPNVVRVYNSLATFWEIKWMYFNSLTDMTVDMETSALVGASLGASMSGWAQPGGIWTLGQVLKPGGAIYWPF